jgi:hypothetical protein
VTNSGTLFADLDFAALYPERGQPAFARGGLL